MLSIIWSQHAHSYTTPIKGDIRNECMNALNNTCLTNLCEKEILTTLEVLNMEKPIFQQRGVCICRVTM